MHNWFLLGSVLWGVLSLYYFRVDGSVRTQAFGQAFALFAIFTAAAALTVVWKRVRGQTRGPGRPVRLVDRRPLRGKRVPDRRKSGIFVPASRLYRYG